MKISRSSFGKVKDTEVFLFTVTNKHGASIKLTNYGATLTSVIVPDVRKRMDDVVLGFDSVDGYLGNQPYMGCICGRFANRVAGAEFTLDGKKFKLPVNSGKLCLHGGINGFDKVIWDAEEFIDSNEAGVKLTYFSADGEEGFPGNLKVTVIYSFSQEHEVKIIYHAETDKPTHLNLTNHSYFNLTGGREDIVNHELMINADRITVVDDELVPTGQFLDVQGTSFDFMSAKSIGTDISKTGDGYDQNFVLKKSAGLALVATVYEQVTGRVMEVLTTEPGIQLYTANGLDGSLIGKYRLAYRKHFGLCLEAQHFPDAMHHPQFPSTLLKPGEKYYQETVYRFKTI